MAACPAITSDTDPCWAAQVIQSEKGPAAADEWTPESFARTFGQTIVSLTDAGQSVHHQCNPTFCEDLITDGKTIYAGPVILVPHRRGRDDPRNEAKAPKQTVALTLRH
jgi:hypothetical protein